MANFTNYYHNENQNTIIDYYKGGTNRISDIRIDSTEYNFLNGEHFFCTSAVLSGNCNGYGGLGFKKLHSKEFQTREEADADCWKKIQKWLIKNEGIMVEIA